MKFEEVEKEIIKKAFDLDKYLETLEKDKMNDEKNFQSYKDNFTAFYKVRRNKDWRNEYYDFLKINKDRIDISFKEIIEGLNSKDKKYTNKNIEPSFSSKLLSTINPNKPIWDKYVLKYVIGEKEIKDYNNKKREEKLNKAIEIYETIEKKYKKELKNSETKKTIDKIRKILNEEKLTDIKILDYIIWTIERKK